jgi:hypothetical protein
MFDNDHLHENPPTYHAVEPLHFSFKDKILSDKGEQEYFQTLIDQRSIHSNSPSRVHNFENILQTRFLEHNETQFDHDNLILMIIFLFQK